MLRLCINGSMPSAIAINKPLGKNSGPLNAYERGKALYQAGIVTAQRPMSMPIVEAQPKPRPGPT